MMRSSTKVLGALILTAAGCMAQAQVKRVPAKPANTMEGKELYRQYCAVCHGLEGKGGGPAAAALTAAPSDLTTASRRNGGKYPEVRILRAINGEVGVPAHGSADMPVW